MLTAFDHAGRRFATVAADGRLSVWDTAASKLSQSFPRPMHLTVRWTSISWQPASEASNGLLALGSNAGIVVVWDISRGEIIHELHGHTQAVHDVVFFDGQDGPQLLSTADDRLIICWSLQTGEQANVHKTGKAAVHRIALTTTSTHALLGSASLKLVKTADWKRVGRLAGHAEAVQCLCFSHDDHLALSASGERHVSLWRSSPAAVNVTADGACLQSLVLERAVKSVSFCPEPVLEGVYVFLVLTIGGDLGIWKLELPSNWGKKKKEKHLSEMPPLSPTADCVVKVANAEANGGANDSQRITAAHFSAGSEVIVAYGSAVKPSFAQCRFRDIDGLFFPSVELPRVSSGLFNPSEALPKSPKMKDKRTRDLGAVQLLGAMDMALPAASRRKGEPGSEPINGGSLLVEDSGSGGTTQYHPSLLGTLASNQLQFQPQHWPQHMQIRTDLGRGFLPSYHEIPPLLSRASSLLVTNVTNRFWFACIAEMPSFGQRLSAMEAAGSSTEGVGGKAKRPTAATQVAFLVQALQNGDAAMLDQALVTQDAASITGTVARLPVASVIPLLEAVLQRIQGKPARVASLASWLRALLAQHPAYLMSCQQLLPLLTPLYQLIDERLSVFKPLLKLVGRMQMLQSQIAAHAASGQNEGQASSDPTITYDEAEEVRFLFSPK